MWAVDGAGNEGWVLITTDDDGETNGCDAETGPWTSRYYGMMNAEGDKLHTLGWLAYKSRPSREDAKDTNVPTNFDRITASKERLARAGIYHSVETQLWIAVFAGRGFHTPLAAINANLEYLSQT